MARHGVVLTCVMLGAASVGWGAGKATVTIDNFSFGPAAIEVTAGTTVVWTNRDDIPHSVVDRDDPRAMNSHALDTDETFSFTFAHPGTYAYFCSLHPRMTGTVIAR